jgi:hypothetical protein
MQMTRKRFVIGFFWDSWLLAALPWIQRGHCDGTVLCLGPIRFGWREAE